MVESALLSKDEPLTPNVDKVMGFEFLEGGLKIQKPAKIGLLDSFFSARERENPFKPFSHNYGSVCARKKG